MTIGGQAVDISGLVGVVVSVVGALLAWALNAIRKKQEADTAAQRATNAWLKLAELVTTLAGRIWDKLGAELQTSLADGKIDADERKRIEFIAKTALEELTDAATLEQLAKAVGLPVPGIIAWVAAKLVDLWTKAHDPDIVDSASALSFPISPERQPGVSEPGAVDAGG